MFRREAVESSKRSITITLDENLLLCSIRSRSYHKQLHSIKRAESVKYVSSVICLKTTTTSRLLSEKKLVAFVKV